MSIVKLVPTRALGVVAVMVGACFALANGSGAPGAEPRIHALIVSDVAPWAGWGKLAPNVEMDSTMMFAALMNNVPERQLELIPLQAFDDPSSRPELILDVLAETQCDEMDVLFVYFTGHGGHDELGQYLEFRGGKLYRSKLKEAMAARGAKFNVLITDCCNSRSDGRKIYAAAPELIPPPRITPLFGSLLLGKRGWVDITSSSPGQASFFVPDFDRPGRFPGSIFTTQLTEWFERHRDERLTWERLLRDVSMSTEIGFREYYPRGATVAKGAPTQTDQSVWAYAYPGMPEKSRPRSGITVRDRPAGGVFVVSVDDDSPATEVYAIDLKAFARLESGDAITEVHGASIADAESFVAAIRDAPQIVRMTVQEANGQTHVVLMRMRY